MNPYDETKAINLALIIQLRLEINEGCYSVKFDAIEWYFRTKQQAVTVYENVIRLAQEGRYHG